MRFIINERKIDTVIIDPHYEKKHADTVNIVTGENMEKYKMPSEKKLKAIRKKLSRVRGSYILPPNVNAVARTKYDLCKRVLLYMRRKGLSQRQLAKLMGIPETRVSEIVHYRISKFTLDRLVEYYEKIEPKITLKVA